MITTGFHHSAQNDINQIKQLLAGYDGKENFLKEVVQNAEDAKATNFCLHFCAPNPALSLHPLLRGPSLVVVNNGDFNEKDCNAIQTIGESNKTADGEKIGRFGLGLKSVFSLCDAFFFVVSTNYAIKGNRSWFVNPYHGWKHNDWNEKATEIGESLLSETEKIVTMSEKWIAFWIPLRLSEHARDREHNVIHCSKYFPGSENGFSEILRREFSAFTKKVSLLRHVKALAFSSNGDEISEIRIERTPLQTPTESTEKSKINGKVILDSNVTVSYQGIAGHLNAPVFSEIKKDKSWPTTTDPEGKCDEIPEKGEPHYACIIVKDEHDKKENDAATLTFEWNVFFPVGKQRETVEIQGHHIKHSIKIILHGCFFLDSHRTKIIGVDDSFMPISDKDKELEKLKLRWNENLARKGALKSILSVLRNYVETQKLSVEQIADLIKAIKTTKIWVSFRATICGSLYYVKTSKQNENGEIYSHWELLAPENCLYIPLYDLSVCEIWELFPFTNFFGKNTHIIHEKNGCLYSGELKTMSSEILQKLLKNVNKNALIKSRKSLLKWLLRCPQEFIQEQRKIIDSLQLFEITSIKNQQKAEIISWEDFKSLAQQQQLFIVSKTNERQLVAYAQLRGDEEEIFFVEKETCLDFEWQKQEKVSFTFTEENLKILLANTNLSKDPKNIPCRKTLIKWLLPKIQEFFPEIRYLIHGSLVHKEDNETPLFFNAQIAEKNEKAWKKLFTLLWDKNPESIEWTNVEANLVDEMNDAQKKERKIAPIGEDAVFELLARCGEPEKLDFSNWEENDIANLLTEFSSLIQKDSNLFKRLCLFRIIDTSNERKFIFADSSEGIFLENNDIKISADKEKLNSFSFEDLNSQLSKILNQLPIVHKIDNPAAAAVQETIIGKEKILSLAAVIRKILEQANPEEFCGLVFHAYSTAGNISGVNFGELKNLKFIKTENHGAISPSSILHIDGFDEEIQKFFPPDSHILTEIVPPELQKHSLLRRLIPPSKEVLQKISEEMKNREEDPKQANNFILGISQISDAEDFFSVAKSMKNCSNVPIASFLARIAEILKENNLSKNDIFSIFKFTADSFKINVESNEVAEAQNLCKDVLSFLENDAGMEMHKRYILQFVADERLKKFLSEIRLPNQCGEWKNVNMLTWFEDSGDTPPEITLSEEYAKILNPYDTIKESILYMERREYWRSEQKSAEKMYDEGTPDEDARTKIILDYFNSLKRFENLHLPFCATFTAVICPQNIAVVEYVEKLLLSAGREGFSKFKEMYFEELQNLNSHPVYSVSIYQNNDVQTRSITGSSIDYRPITDINNLLVNQSSLEDNRIILRYPPEDMFDKIVELWDKTLKVISDDIRLRNKSMRFINPRILKLLQEAEKDSVLIASTQFALLETTNERLRLLNCHSKPTFSAISKRFDEIQREKLSKDDEYVRSNARDKSERRGEMLYQIDEKKRKIGTNFKDIILKNEEAEHELINASKRKIQEQGYSPKSVLLEFFQNADDALLERIGSIGDFDKRFGVYYDTKQNRLLIYHWGRPINQCSIGEEKQGKNLDLYKMLSWNISDKAADNKHSDEISQTGRFGLGFKSVFLVCERPLIFSETLLCRIRGSFLPMGAKDERALIDSCIETVIEGEKQKEGLTLFILDNLSQEVFSLLESFRKLSSYLIHTAKKISEMKMHSDNLQYSIKCEKNLEHGRWFIQKPTENEHLFVVRCNEANSDSCSPASWIFSMDSNGFVPRKSFVNPLWVTVPTQENSAINCIVNAGWELDPGRKHIRFTEQDSKTAKKTANALREALRELIEKCGNDWQTLRTEFSLHENVEPYSFWESFWKIVCPDYTLQNWENYDNNNNSNSQRPDILKALLWDEKFGAIRQLILENVFRFPSGISVGSYKTLLSIDEARYALDEETEKVFDKCLNWMNWRRIIKSGIVNQKTAKLLRELKPDIEIEELTLEKIVRDEIGEAKKIDAETAKALGSLLNRDFQKYNPKLWDTLKEFLTSCGFRCANDEYCVASEIVVGHEVVGAADMIDRDERLRATIAPESLRLHENFNSKDAIEFFVLCRERLNADVEQLSKWIQDFDENDSRYESLFRYLYSRGTLALNLARKLGLPWMKSRQGISAFQLLEEKNKETIWQLFGDKTLGGTYDRRLDILDVSQYSLTSSILPRCSLSENVSFNQICRWWSENYETLIKDFERKLYGSISPFPLFLPGDSNYDNHEEEQRRRWMILFIHAALMTEGWYKPERSREFVQFFDEKGFLIRFVDSEKITQDFGKILDEFLDEKTGGISHYHQMRQSISFYATSKNLDTLLAWISDAQKDGNFDISGTKLTFQGSGINAPSFSRAFGMGKNFIIRELFRKGVFTLHNNQSNFSNNFQYQSFVPYGKTRKFCQWLWGCEDSRENFSEHLVQKLRTLSAKNKAEWTFQNCFDIPLYILAGDAELRKQVLGNNIDEPSFSDDEDSFIATSSSDAND